MKVAILGDRLKKPLTGIGYYTRSLALHLAQEFPENTYSIIHPASPRYERLPLSTIDVPLNDGLLRKGRTALWEIHGGPKAAARGNFDIILAPGNIKSFAIPYRTRAKRVMTIHDLTPLVLPDSHKPRIRLEFKLLANRSVRLCDGVLTDSNASEADIARLIPASRSIPVRPVSLGVDERFFVAPQPIEMDLPDRYFLCVGSIEPRKNLGTVLGAFEHYREGGGDAELVIAGPSGWRNSAFYKRLHASPFADYVRFTGYVPDAILPQIYANALALLYPSRYEGFGLPILEAMASGCPVVTSNVSSMPEVVGEAGIMVDPDDFKGLAGWMGRLATEEELSRRLRVQGISHAAGFSWSRTARETQRFFDEL